MKEEPPPASPLPDDLAEHVLAQLLAVEVEGRPVLLEELIAQSPEHAAALRALGAELHGAERMLELTFPDRGPDVPTTIGGHRVIRRLGEGAFGVVFLCEQTRPVVRQVAVKVLRPGAGDWNTLRRFETERQLLASLNHPAITQIFDAGRLPDGRPYFVMEYVDGRPIHQYCEERQLSCDERLQLFLDVCRGVAHAHDRDIVHRDLKPANVLIVDGDGVGQPKIIDFGIAKALHPTTTSGQPAPLLTDAGRVIGTPGYMSPEQAAGQVQAIDGRTDVFSLGVILYELLTGELPWPEGAVATERTPDRPSARVTSRSTGAPARWPQTTRPRIAELRGDLDWITLTALERERERRYRSVRDLIDDIDRHRRGQTIAARPPSVGYRVSKYVRRNRVVVASLAAMIAIVGFATIGAVAYARVADSATETAQSAADANWAAATAAIDRLLARANDDRLRHAPQSDAVRQVLLQDAVEFYDRFLADQPSDTQLRVGRCNALLTLSEICFQLGQLESAQKFAGEALVEATALQQAVPGDVARLGMLAEAERRVGRAMAASGQVAAAAPLFEQAVEHLGVCFAASPHDHGLSYSSAWREVATCRQSLGQDDECADAYRRSVAVLEELLPSATDADAVRNDLVIALGGLGQYLLLRGALDQSAAVLTRAEALLPEVTFEAARARNMIAGALGRIAGGRGDWPNAVAHLDRAAEAAAVWQRQEPTRILPQDTLFKNLRLLGEAQDRLAAFDAATATYRRAIECAEAMVAAFPEDPTRASTLVDALRTIAYCLWDRYRLVDLPQAELWAVQAVEVHEHLSPTIEPASRGARWQGEMVLALIRDSLGRSDAELWERIAAQLPTAGGRTAIESDRILAAWLGVARSRLGAGRSAAAAEALATAKRIVADGGPQLAKRAVELGRLEAHSAVARRDPESAARAAEFILTARSTWFGRQRAGEAYFLAWRCASDDPTIDSATTAGYAGHAVEQLRAVVDALAEDVAKAPDDPWFVVPWALSLLRQAQLAAAGGRAGEARELLERAMPPLERMLEQAPRDELDPAVVSEGRALAQALGAR